MITYKEYKKSTQLLRNFAFLNILKDFLVIPLFLIAILNIILLGIIFNPVEINSTFNSSKFNLILSTISLSSLIGIALFLLIVYYQNPISYIILFYEKFKKSNHCKKLIHINKNIFNNLKDDDLLKTITLQFRQESLKFNIDKKYQKLFQSYTSFHMFMIEKDYEMALLYILEMKKQTRNLTKNSYYLVEKELINKDNK